MDKRGECVCSKDDGLVSPIPDHNPKAREAVLICRAEEELVRTGGSMSSWPPNGSFILSLEGLDRRSRSRSMGIENFHAQALHLARSGLWSVSGGREAEGLWQRTAWAAKVPVPMPMAVRGWLCCNPRNPGSSRVFQGSSCASALAGVPPTSERQAECGRILTRYWYTVHQALTPPPAFSTRQIGHVLDYPHYSLSPALVQCIAILPSGQGTQMEPLSKLPELSPRTGVFPTSLH
jgi:hypothetical protein